MSEQIRPRISVINDNPEFLELMSAILEEDAAYDVTLHDGAHASFDEIRGSRPDLLIVDLLMAGQTGWEIVTLARADASLAEVPIIICTADLAQLGEREPELASIGNVHVLRKPFSIDEMTGLVDQLVPPRAMPAVLTTPDAAVDGAPPQPPSG